jgi:hypothetical protein
VTAYNKFNSNYFSMQPTPLEMQPITGSTWALAAGGFFTGKYLRDQPAPTDSRYGAFWRGFNRDGFTKDRVFDLQQA